MSEHKRQMLRVIAPATAVRLGPDAEIEAVVVKATLSESGVEYEVVYWSGGARQVARVSPCEITSGGEYVRVGFVTGLKEGQQP